MTKRPSIEKTLADLHDPSMDPGDLADLLIDIAHSELIGDDEIRAAIVGLVAHDDPDVRHAAIVALAFHGVALRWDQEPGSVLLRLLIRVLKQDPDRDCRRVAAAALGSLFRGSRRPEVVRSLVEVCEDFAEFADVRAFAYTGVLDLLGVPRPQQPSAFNLILTPEHLSKLREMLSHS